MQSAIVDVKAEDFKASSIFKQMVRRNRVYVVQYKNGIKTYSQITSNQENCLKHVLKKELVPEESSIVIKLEEILRSVGCKNQKTFLEIGHNGTPMGTMVA